MKANINISENDKSFLSRFYIYQKERFPFLAHGLLISAFTFSAISYSRICRGAEGFIELKTFLFAIFTTISLFLLLRISDEFKDHEEDRQYRKYLPVIRGLISLRELAIVGVGVLGMQFVAHFLGFTQMFPLYFLVLAYLVLMGKEFFVGEWLKKHQLLYVVSHMLIIPLVDIYASGLDWMLEGAKPHAGLLFFFAVSFMNGIVLEFGRKIKAPHLEEEGVVSYSALYGAKRATIYWMLSLFVTMILAVAASLYAGYGLIVVDIFVGLFVLAVFPAILFLKHKDEKSAKWIEKASGLWAVAMYLCLGGIPMLAKLF